MNELCEVSSLFTDFMLL